MKCWTSYTGVSFLNKNHLPKDIICEFVSAGELFNVTDVELKCGIAQPSINAFKCGYGNVQEHLRDFGFYWTGIAINIWQGKSSPVALYSIKNPIRIPSLRLFNSSWIARWFYCYTR